MNTEETQDLVDCLKRLEQAAAEDNWCEFSGYSSRLVWEHIEQLAALAFGRTSTETTESR